MEKPRLSPNLAVAAVLAFMGAWMLLSGTSSATRDIQKMAKHKGFPATNCLYCHSERSPRTGAVTYNERGRWLLAERDRRLAREIDPAWLHFYPGGRR